MPIAVQDLYKPINDFFMTKYGTATDDVVFRFDQFGSVISDLDFIDDNHPDAGPAAALATEKFSDLVNRLPLDSGDGVHVILTQAAIDEIYNFQLLMPAVPQVPSSADTFNALKAQGKKLWEQLTLQSLSGLMLNYKPSLASPEDWYDSRSSQSWTSQTFDIESSPAAEATAVWELRPSEQQIVESLKLPPAARTPGPELLQHLRQAQLSLPVAHPMLMARGGPDLADAPQRGDGAGTVLNQAVLSDVAGLGIKKRIAISQALGRVAPRAAASTSRVNVGFEYCLVQIRRPWWLDSFVNDPSWCLPGVPPGSLTATGNPAGLSWLPVAFAAVRNLRIDSSWSGDDMVNAAQANGFGPFRVQLDTGSQSLVHPGLQVVGWVLHRLPALPPATVSDPAPVHHPQIYVVQPGDTLRRIAQHFYGDPKLWPQIQQANHIANPNLIHVGEQLTIPPAR